MTQSPILTWILAHKPENDADAVFISNNRLFYGILGCDDSAAEDMDAILDCELIEITDKLLTEHSIAIQPGAVRNGIRGIRIMNIE